MRSKTLLSHLHCTSQMSDRIVSSQVGALDTTQKSKAAEDVLKSIEARLRSVGNVQADRRSAQALGTEDLLGFGNWASKSA